MRAFVELIQIAEALDVSPVMILEACLRKMRSGEDA